MVPNISSWDCVVLEQNFVLSSIRSKYFGNSGDINLRSIRRTDMKTIVVKDEKEGMADAIAGDENASSLPMTEKWIAWQDQNRQSRGQDETISKRTRWLISTCDMGSSIFPFETLFKQEIETLLKKQYPGSPDNIPFVADFVLEAPWKDSISGSLFDPIWQQFFGNEWIPWKKTARQTKFLKAYRQLAPYLAHYE